MFLDTLRPFIISFIVIFVSIDILEKVPLFLSITEKFSHKQKKKIIRNSVLYTLILAAAFLLLTNFLLWISGITAADFEIAGGLLLLFISINTIITKRVHFFYKESRMADIGIFPLATPLITRPSLFIVSFVSLEKFGAIVALTMIILNLALSWLALEKSELVIKFIGRRGIKTFSKISSILLAAFAVMIARQGIVETFIKQ